MIKSVLIANRGEIACRIARTATQLGIHTVGVYSSADINSPHLDSVNEAIHIGQPQVQSSYLNHEVIIQAAKKTGVEAIHPGYGFLSENSVFAENCLQEKLIFIGPDSYALSLMGNKRAAKIAVSEVNVPCIPGYEGEDQSDDAFSQAAEQIGFPLMIKASAGGGGKGMRIVHDRDALKGALNSARSEAMNAFGSDELIIEKYINHPRHIEIQIFADTHGTILHLGERECSIQRRHQKVIEEAPSSVLSPSLRKRMGEAAIQTAKVCQYVGAGTVEFIMGPDGQFYFLEMNTRLQVEHPVTELITGINLVEWQFRIASGEALPLKQDAIRSTGHAIEARLYAEDPYHQFLPQTGVISYLKMPDCSSDGERIDHAIKQGIEISPYYDPMLGKWIAWGKNRQEAILTLKKLLGETIIHGIPHNRAFLTDILNEPGFLEGDLSTHFIDNNPHLTAQTPTISFKYLLFAAMRLSIEAQTLPSSGYKSTITRSPAGMFQRSNPFVRTLIINFRTNEVNYTLKGACTPQPMTYKWTLHSDHQQAVKSEAHHLVRFVEMIEESQLLTLIIDDIQSSETVSLTGSCVFIDTPQGHVSFEDTTYPELNASISEQQSGLIVAPMDGRIVTVNIAAGQEVTEGETLLIMEAMKMEHPIKAPYSGKVETVSVQTQQQAKRSQTLAILKSA